MRPLYIGGATGTGKSAVALEIAARTDGEIVNADAFQLYRGLEIVSAAPTSAERALATHHLFGCMEVDEECNAARYAQLARGAIDLLISRDRLPIVVGGSGLYLKALTHGLSDLPPADDALRHELDSLSLEDLVAKLRGLDPRGAAQVDPLNRRYVTRAVEICILSNRPMSEVKRGWQRAAPNFDGFLLERPRAQLYARIDARVQKMVEAGLLEEIRALPDGLSATAVKAIGVADVRSHLSGMCTLDECVAAIQQASRRLAKRQLTWFKRETGFQRICLDADETAESAAGRVLELFPHLHHV